ncbi:MAG: adenylate/guanylate cyclase domain-containing protein [Candidatus Cloacimonetes bacterium]|nr:adenylate/guanylate cyclase domain-containing protein [Candidatus Cloacimonadota bacterium]
MIKKNKIIFYSLAIPIGCYLLISLIFLLFAETHIRLENIFLDRLFINRYEKPTLSENQSVVLSKDISTLGFEPIIVVTIDKKTLETMPTLDQFKSGPYKDFNTQAWPYDRRVTAMAIDKLKALGVLTIGIDLLFIHEQSKEADLALAKSIKAADNVILASLFESNNSGVVYKEPIPILKESAAGIGFVNVPVDTDGILRRMLIYLENQQSQKVSSFSLKLWNNFPFNKNFSLDKSSKVDQQWHIPNNTPNFPSKKIHLANDTTSQDKFIINYRGPVDTYPNVSYCDLFDDSQTDKLKKVFKGKIVLIGLNHPGLQDMYPTPFYVYDRKQTSGVEIHANALYTLLSDKLPSIKKLGHLENFFIFYLLACILTLGTGFLAIRYSLPLLIIELLSYWIFVHFLFKSHYLAAIAPTLIAICASYVCVITARMMAREQEKSVIRKVFNQYVSNQVVDQLLLNPENLAMGGGSLEITTLFSDVRGFTTMSENKTPEQVVDILNTYFELMVAIISKYNGTINKFIGDAIMVLYGAPPMPDNDPQVQAINAVKTAVEMQETIKANTDPKLKLLNIGIGITTGFSVVGNIGAKKHKDYTAIGDKINLAARLESKAKAFDVIIDANTYEYCKDEFSFEELEPFQVKGKQEIIKAYRVLF